MPLADPHLAFLEIVAACTDREKPKTATEMKRIAANSRSSNNEDQGNDKVTRVYEWEFFSIPQQQELNYHHLSER
jgi:hypothetical protein